MSIKKIEDIFNEVLTGGHIKKRVSFLGFFMYKRDNSNHTTRMAL